MLSLYLSWVVSKKYIGPTRWVGWDARSLFAGDLHRLERFARVVGDIAAADVVVGQLHHALLVDYESYALDLLVLVHAHAKALPEFALFVGQQPEGYVQLGGELGLRRW